MATSENEIIFKKTSGHTHDGESSTIIDTTKYSLYDFSPTKTTPTTIPRKNNQNTNENLIKDLIRDTVSQMKLTPPPGSLVPYAGSNAPDGWLLCFGQVVNRMSYPSLFSAIGTSYNTGGEAATDFRLPDLRGRVIAGLDNMGGSDSGRLNDTNWPNTIGTTGGTETVTLDSTQIPSHSHTYHTQYLLGGGTAGTNGSAITGNSSAAFPLSTYTAIPSQSTANTGGGGSHNNMQPTMLLNYIIKI